MQMFAAKKQIQGNETCNLIIFIKLIKLENIMVMDVSGIYIYENDMSLEYISQNFSPPSTSGLVIVFKR